MHNLQPFERVYIAVSDAITFEELQHRWPSISHDEFIDEIENGLFSGFPRPFGVIQKLKDPSTGEIFYQCEYIPPGTQMRERPQQQFIIGYTPSWEGHLEAERQERLARWKGGFVYFLEYVERYETDNPSLKFAPVNEPSVCENISATGTACPPHTEMCDGATPQTGQQHTDISAWQAIIDTGHLSASDRIAASLAVEKIKGKTHAEAYDAVCSGTVVTNKAEYVSKRRTRAEALAKLHGLNMPDWRSM